MATNLSECTSSEVARSLHSSLTHLKILHIVGDSKFGGAASCILRLAEMWHGEVDVSILTTDTELQKAARSAGIGVVDLVCIRRKIRPLWDLAGLIRLWRFLKNENFTVVHTHTTKAGYIGRIAARMAHVPVILHTAHGFAFHEGSSRANVAFCALLERIAARCCDRIATVSEFHRRWALELNIAESGRVRAIPNGTPDMLAGAHVSRREVRGKLGISDEDIMLFTPGRLAREKGLETLFKALARTRAIQNRRLTLVLAGDGPTRAALERRARDLGVRGHVQFLGFRHDIKELLSAADIVVLPSLREGLSVALLEAMSAGQAIIATSIGSNLEAVNAVRGSSQAAVIVPVEDEEALAHAIVVLSWNAETRSWIGNKARALWEEKYTLDRMVMAYHETYLELVRGKLLGDSHEICHRVNRL
jgi:glycosyltransferase involved in cell wall biosynthesis